MLLPIKCVSHIICQSQENKEAYDRCVILCTLVLILNVVNCANEHDRLSH